MRILFILIVMLAGFEAAALSPREKIEKSCQKYTEEQILQNRAPQCRNAVSTYLKHILKNKIKRFDQGLYAYLFLGLRIDIPEAFQVIEKEIYDGHLNEWIDKLQNLKTEQYEESLVKWARHIESEVRKLYKSNLNKNNAYAVEIENMENAPALMSIWSPILMTKYLELLMQESYHVTEKDFESLDVIYAFSTQSFREVFREQTAEVVMKASDEWVKSVRKEQSWVLFRLFPLVPKHADGNIKRELIWLSQYHQDYKIRALSSSTLAKIANS